MNHRSHPNSPDHSLRPDVICLSHLRWNFVFQRPQHLMTRCARDRRVFFFEEPVFEDGIPPRLAVDRSGPVIVAVPHLPRGLDEHRINELQRALLDALIANDGIRDFVAWYYT